MLVFERDCFWLRVWLLILGGGGCTAIVSEDSLSLQLARKHSEFSQLSNFSTKNQ
jgi:hypothetical protein